MLGCGVCYQAKLTAFHTTVRARQHNVTHLNQKWEGSESVVPRILCFALPIFIVQVHIDTFYGLIYGQLVRFKCIRASIAQVMFQEMSGKAQIHNETTNKFRIKFIVWADDGPRHRAVVISSNKFYLYIEKHRIHTSNRCSPYKFNKFTVI